MELIWNWFVHKNFDFGYGERIAVEIYEFFLFFVFNMAFEFIILTRGRSNSSDSFSSNLIHPIGTCRRFNGIPYSDQALFDVIIQLKCDQLSKFQLTNTPFKVGLSLFIAHSNHNLYIVIGIESHSIIASWKKIGQQIK